MQLKPIQAAKGRGGHYFIPGLLSFLWSGLNVTCRDLGDSYAEQRAFKTADCLNYLEQVGSLEAVWPSLSCMQRPKGNKHSLPDEW